MTLGIFFLAGALSLGALQEPTGFRLLDAAIPKPPLKQGPIVGLPVFGLEIDTKGSVSDITLISGQPPFIEQSREAMKDWTFSPNKRSAPVSVSAVFAYKPRTMLPDSTSEFHIPVPDDAPNSGPPLPVRVVVPGYPSDANGEGPVIMQAHVNGHGDVTHIDVIRSIPVLTDVAVAALGAWKFTEAQSKETADVSPRIAIVVISFQSPEYPGYPISAGSSMAKDAGPSR